MRWFKFQVHSELLFFVNFGNIFHLITKELCCREMLLLHMCTILMCLLSCCELSDEGKQRMNHVFCLEDFFCHCWVGLTTHRSVILLKAPRLILGNKALALSKLFSSQSKINACCTEIFCLDGKEWKYPSSLITVSLFPCFPAKFPTSTHSLCSCCTWHNVGSSQLTSSQLRKTRVNPRCLEGV